MIQTFNLPDAGEGLTEADIAQWLVGPGDTVTLNQVIVEVETAKSLVELPSPYAGTVAELLAAVGDTVAVGAPLIRIEDGVGAEPGSGPDAGAAGALDAAGSAGGRDDGAGAGADTATAPKPGLGTATDASTSADSGPGADTDTAAAAEPGTGTDAGASTGAESGARAVLVGYGVRPDGLDAELGARRETAPDATGTGAGSAGGSGSGTGAAASGRGAGAGWDVPPVLAKPPVRKLARDLGLDLATITPTGPGGIVTREDVVAAQASQSARSLAFYPGDDAPWLDGGSVSRDGRTTRVPVRSVRKRTAEAMVTSAFTAPHVSVFHTVDVTRTMKLVEELRHDREFSGVRVTPLLIAIKALLLAVHRHPEINASWDAQAQEIVYKHYVNLGVAAATPRGLVVPNIKDAHRRTLHELAVALGELTVTAREGRTTPSAMSDGTITVTNVGVFGIDSGTPILNPGEAAILAFGAVTRRPWIHKDKVRARWVTDLALSFDHRLVDGELGSRVLADVAAVLHDPARALVWG